jgi:hypothetical protein
MGLLLFIRIPQLERFFMPTLPESPVDSGALSNGDQSSRLRQQVE